MMKRLLYSVFAVGMVGIARPAFAQNQAADDPVSSPANEATVAEILVTAERRTSTAQKTAASISVISGGELAMEGRYSLSDIVEDMPGTDFGTGESGRARSGRATDSPAADLTIRGIRSNVGVAGSATSTATTAAIYVDDVYNGIGGSYDIDRVELLRGPQGTLYGRSATSGVLAIHTKAPDPSDLGADASLETGSYDLFHVTGGVNVPLVNDKAALRVSGNYYERDGYYASRDSGGGRFSNADGRAKLLLKPSENLTAILGFAFQENRTRTPGVQINQTAPNQFDIFDIEWRSGKNGSRQYWAVIDLDLGDVALTYVPAFRTFNTKSQVVTRGNGLNIDNDIDTSKDHFHTQELRLRSNDASAPLQWQTGVMYYNNSLDDVSHVTMSVGGPYGSGPMLAHADTSKTTTAIGVFAEGTLNLSDGTRLTAGIRYDNTKVVTEQTYTSVLGATEYLLGDEGIRKFNNVTYKFRIEHDLTARNMIYGSVSTGFSPGDVTLTTGTDGRPKLIELNAETLTSFEIGTKNRFAGGRLQVNGALYYIDYGGFQAANINLTPQLPYSSYANIKMPLTVRGAELEIMARPWANGQFSASFAFTRARYHDIPAEYDYVIAFSQVEGVAPFTANLSYDHTASVGRGTELILGADLRFASAHNVANLYDAYLPYARDYVHVGGQATVDLRATASFDDGRYALTGYVRNLTDNRYKTYGITSVDSADASGVVSSAGLNAPRTWGLVTSARF
ncbi:putative outer membrane salicin receptor [Novosphingobium sp. Rr 2-17]|uniref:TonB-dependent receptor n=1 Tax=Novosphingobium sp. Rr 2-17 TaxID=555793 RepID=UPI000269985A|nr:TonB-dependent receptor [Novosphingobium sp. Rr 2-17]EIZ79802.1 putative outer membrane salicin receptor [Novosphingobium sp. Rr 2-17]